MRIRVTTSLCVWGIDTSGSRPIRKADEQTITNNNVSNLAPHPHAGKIGIITELLGVRIAIGKPRAMVRIDPGFEHAGNIMIVGLEYLEEVDGSAAKQT